MASFKFTLQPLFQHREELVRACEVELENARKVCRELRELLDQERDAYFGEREEMNQHMRESRINMVGIYEGSLQARKERLMELLRSIRAAEADVDLAEQILVQARRNFKVIENLREKKLGEHNKRIEEKDRKFLDEQATLRHARRDTPESKKARD